jgi:rhodanese-related sulfurtransferase
MQFFIDNAYLVIIALVSGGMLLWPVLRRSGGASVSPAQATTMINREDALVFDVRPAAAYAEGRILAARSVPVTDIEARAGDLAKFKNRAVIVCDESGTAATKALDALRKLGFNNVVSLAGGFAGWRQAGLPTEK